MNGPLRSADFKKKERKKETHGSVITTASDINFRRTEGNGEDWRVEPLPFRSVRYSAETVWMLLDVACCGALLYPRARSWNVETCGPADSARWQKTVGMPLLVPLSIYTHTSLQFKERERRKKSSFVSLILPKCLLCCRSHSPRGEFEESCKWLCECVYDSQL